MKEKARDALIALWAIGSRHWGQLLRPGTTVAIVVVVLAGAGRFLKDQEIPDAEFWAAGTAANASLAVVQVVFALTALLVALGYRRLLRKNQEQADFSPSDQLPAIGRLLDALEPPDPRLALRRAVAYWLTGNSLPDAPHSPARRAAIEATVAAVERDDHAELETFLAEGLELRDGEHLDPREQTIYAALLAARVADPDGLTVCFGSDSRPIGCGVVFRPSRKGEARLCPMCHDHPVRVDLDAWRAAGFVRFDGRAARYLTTCPGCGGDFYARPDQRACSAACRVRVHRAVPRNA